MRRRMMAALMLAAALALPRLNAVEQKTGSGGVRAPNEPAAPDVDMEKKKRPDGDGVPATVEMATGEKMTGVLVITFDSLEIETAEAGGSRVTAVPLGAIDSIEFIRWAGKELRKNEFAFYHAAARITLTDKKVIESVRNIPALNRLVFKDAKGSRRLYSFFYDYRKDGTWKNSGKADIAYPETNPHGDALVRIMFLKKEEVNPLDTIFRIIQGERK